MQRRASLVPLVSLGCAGALVLATFAAGPAASAPRDTGPRGTASGQPQVPGRGDADGDRVSDDLEQRLRRADASERLAVIVTGLTSTKAATTAGWFRVTHQLPIIDGFSAVMTAGQASALSRHPGLSRIAADGVVRALDDAGNSDFGATAARGDRAGLDGSGVGVCVVDTGIDPAHEQVSGRVVGFYDAVNGRTTPYDDHGHGTHVAAIAAGDGTGSTAASVAMGVAPAASLYAAKVLDASGFGSDSEVIAGVQWCHAQDGVEGMPDVRVISMSLGDDAPSDGTDLLSQAVNAAVAEGDVVVVAAGNSGDQPRTINAPGVATGAVTVGAASDWSAPAGTARHDDGIWLAAFSSRGPVQRADGSLSVKPDVTAPGVSVTAAKAGTTSGYVTMSGTSMATPYVAGAVALGLEADAGATPTEVKDALVQTAADRGAPGTDNEWGAGLVDVRELVDVLAGEAEPRGTRFPTSSVHVGTVPKNGYQDIPITIPSDGGGVPLAVTMTSTGGSALCYWGCLIVEWTPDLDMELRSGGTVLARSECALSGLSCGIGRQETIGLRSPVAGATYTLRVYAFTGDPNYGKGGDFRVDVSRGPTVGTTTTPPPTDPPPNTAPTVSAGPDRTVRVNKRTKVATFSLTGSVSDADGTISAWTWRLQGSTVDLAAGSGAGSPSMTDTEPVGTYTYVLSATDDEGATTSDTATVTVRK